MTPQSKLKLKMKKLGKESKEIMGKDIHLLTMSEGEMLRMKKINICLKSKNSHRMHRHKTQRERSRNKKNNWEKSISAFFF